MFINLQEPLLNVHSVMVRIGGDTDDVVRSRKSRGKSSCSVYNMVCIDHC